MRVPDRLWDDGIAILNAGEVPGPPDPSYRRRVGYPLALDIHDRIAAVSFAALDVYPDIASGWWCLVEQFWRNDDGDWCHAGGTHDNTTTPGPFERPAATSNSFADWIDWNSNGGWGDWEVEPFARHSFFGIAGPATARLTVTSLTGRTRDLAIAPWNGTYVAAQEGTHSTLTGYDADGNVLGSLATPPP